MKAYGYLRVSGQGQIDGNGFDRQRSSILDYADKQKIKIVDFFQDGGVSGTVGLDNRPAFQEMITEILRNGTSTVIVEGLDRLAREYRIQESLLVFLASKNITLISARTNENVTEALYNDPMRRALVQMQGVFSELEKNLLVNKLRKSRKKIRASKGKCEGRKGWEDSEDTLNIKLGILKEIRRLRRKPRSNLKRRTFDMVANELNKNNLRTFTGKKWTGVAVQNFLQKN